MILVGAHGLPTARQYILESYIISDGHNTFDNNWCFNLVDDGSS